MNGLFVLHPEAFELIYPSDLRDDIGQLITLAAPPQTSTTILANLDLLKDVDIILSGWGAPVLDEAFMTAAPDLKAFLYGAGSIRAFVTDAFWARNIPISTAAEANAIPVSEYTLSQIIFCLKAGWQLNTLCRDPRIARSTGWINQRSVTGHGCYQSTVGLISMGRIARKVRHLLRALDVSVIAYDPFLSRDEAEILGIELVPLDEVFRRADVVSLHTPDLPETQGMITGHLLSPMKANAAFITTARSAVVRHDELIAVLAVRPDLWAVLDVTEQATDLEFRSLQELPNVTLTPHIAGSTGRECARMGRFMHDELQRFLRGETLRFSVDREEAALMA